MTAKTSGQSQNWQSQQNQGPQGSGVSQFTGTPQTEIIGAVESAIDAVEYIRDSPMIEDKGHELSVTILKDLHSLQRQIRNVGNQSPTGGNFRRFNRPGSDSYQG